MTRPLFILGAGIACVWLMSPLGAGDAGAVQQASASAVPASEDIQPDDTACWFDVDQGGAPRANLTPEDAAWVSVAGLMADEQAHDLYQPSHNECTWMRLEGELRVGLSPLSTASLVDMPGDLQREPGQFWYFQPDLKIMSFHGEAPDLARLDGARAELIGFFKNHCRAAYASNRAYAQENPDRIVMVSGYCHSSVTARLELWDVRIVEVGAPPGRRIAGERNRDIAGDLDIAALSAEDMEIALDVAMKTLLRGPDPEADPSGHIGARLALHRRVSNSALNRLDQSAQRRETMILTPRLSTAYETSDDSAYYVACFCVERSCEDQWPLTYSDAVMLNAPYVCQRLLRRDDGRWSEW